MSTWRPAIDLPPTARARLNGAVTYAPGGVLTSETRATSAYYLQSLDGLGIVYTPGGSLTSETRATAAYYLAQVRGPV